VWGRSWKTQTCGFVSVFLEELMIWPVETGFFVVSVSHFLFFIYLLLFFFSFSIFSPSCLFFFSEDLIDCVFCFSFFCFFVKTNNVKDVWCNDGGSKCQQDSSSYNSQWVIATFDANFLWFDLIESHNGLLIIITN